MIRFENGLDKEFYFEFDDSGLYDLIYYLKNIDIINSITIINQSKEKELKLTITEINTKKNIKKRRKLYVNDDNIKLQITNVEIEQFQFRLEQCKISKTNDQKLLLNRHFRKEWVFIYIRYITKEYLKLLEDTLNIWNYK